LLPSLSVQAARNAWNIGVMICPAWKISAQIVSMPPHMPYWQKIKSHGF